jgi:hypothetical protein
MTQLAKYIYRPSLCLRTYNMPTYSHTHMLEYAPSEYNSATVIFTDTRSSNIPRLCHTSTECEQHHWHPCRDACHAIVEGRPGWGHELDWHSGRNTSRNMSLLLVQKIVEDPSPTQSTLLRKYSPYPTPIISSTIGTLRKHCPDHKIFNLPSSNNYLF